MYVQIICAAAATVVCLIVNNAKIFNIVQRFFFFFALSVNVFLIVRTTNSPMCQLLMHYLPLSLSLSLIPFPIKADALMIRRKWKSVLLCWSKRSAE